MTRIDVIRARCETAPPGSWAKTPSQRESYMRHVDEGIAIEP
jgi:hypothetical protein